MPRKKLVFNPSENDTATLRASGSYNKDEAIRSSHELAVALQLPLREGVLNGNILDGNIFERIQLQENTTAEFPLHFLAPGTEKEFVAYSIPNHGYIPQRHIEGDYVMVPTYDIGNAIDWNLKYARDARWDIVGSAMEVFMAGFVKKWNDDGFHTLITAAADRNLVVLDSDAGSGQFTKRLVSLGKVIMRRNGGGNFTSRGGGRLTDMFMSPEGLEDVRNWNVDEVDEITRREIFLSSNEDAITRIFGVNLHDVYEFGEGQEYQLFYENELGGSLPAGKVEVILGLDLSHSDAFVMPIRENVQVFEDDTLHRQKRQGFYGWAEQGFAVLDNRRVMLLAI